MNVILYLLPIALGLGLLGLAGFLWSLKKGQYEDLEGAALRVLDDDDLPEAERPRRVDDRRA
ncbi:cbb3-type cytochrome oxidase assembly protein CcoS [Salinarimonas chemoclinalis]|uniref:cbb3-type cytochrome oxidase assembly protein CcoS n=1 Tax=Salinarimonas chemoclinalis TaxID=3241599 RepID=UPI00355744EB